MIGLLKTAFRIARTAAASKFGKTNLLSGGGAAGSKAALMNLGVQALFTVPAFMMSHTPEERRETLGISVASWFLTAGMNSPVRQFGWNVALQMAPRFGDMTRGVTNGYRGVLESRTSLAIPFSHSNMAMDQAFATVRYAQSRVGDAYSHYSGEAAFFAARYMQR